MCLIAALLGTFARGYRFGLGDQVADLPFVLRALDPGYLPRDFFVVATEAFGPRFYYAKAMAALARVVPLPALHLHATWIANAGVALVSYAAAWSLTRGSRSAARLAVALVVAVESIQLGSATALVRPDFTPSLAALPAALAAFWLGVAGRPVASALVALPAVVLHPALGLELAALGWLAAAVARAQGTRPSAVRLGTAGLVLAAAAVALWVAPGWDLAAAADWVPIEALLRHPHHSMPSFFPRGDWLRAALFAAGAAVAVRELVRMGDCDARLAVRLGAVGAAVLAAWAGGAFFVEVHPSGFWAAARVFRLALLVKWVGLLLYAGLAAAWLARARSPLDRAAPLLLLLACGPRQPELAAAVAALGAFERGRGASVPPAARAGVWLVAGLAVAHALLFEARAGESLVLAAALGLAAWLGRPARPALRWGVPAAGAAAFLAAVFSGAFAAPRIDLADQRHPVVDVARFARTSTPEDALFVAPPDFGHFRLLAERALVVDFRSFPFSGPAMAEWARRMDDVYGATRRRGYGASHVLDRRYHAIRDEHLLELARRYGAEYAVLYRDTPTRLPVLYEDSAFVVVALEDGPPPPRRAATSGRRASAMAVAATLVPASFQCGSSSKAVGKTPLFAKASSSG